MITRKPARIDWAFRRRVNHAFRAARHDRAAAGSDPATPRIVHDNWTLALVVLVLVLGGLFSVLRIFSLSRSATGGDLDWQIARLERKVDLILTHLGIGHDEHVPELWSIWQRRPHAGGDP